MGVTLDIQTGERIYLDDFVEKLGITFPYSFESDPLLKYASMSEKRYLVEMKDVDIAYRLITLKPSFYLRGNIGFVITAGEVTDAPDLFASICLDCFYENDGYSERKVFLSEDF